MAEAHIALGRNRLLDTFQRLTDARALEGLEIVSLTLRQELYTPNKPIDYAYFPVDGVISMLAQLEEGLLVEVATIGNEGMIGLPLFLGTDIVPGVSFSQVPGHAFRVPADRFKQLVRDNPVLGPLLHRYTQALMVQISQGNGCNRVHSDLKRCARWLLLTHDRVGQDEFGLREEFLSQMLGVRPATTSQIVGELQGADAIHYSGGVVRIIDRSRLETASCACYSIIRDEYERMHTSFAEED